MKVSSKSIEEFSKSYKTIYSQTMLCIGTLCFDKNNDLFNVPYRLVFKYDCIIKNRNILENVPCGRVIIGSLISV